MPTDHRIRHYICLRPSGELADSYAAYRRNRIPQHRRTIQQHAEQRLLTGLRRGGFADRVTGRVVAHPSLGWKLVLADQPELSGPQDEHIWSVEFDMHGPYETALEQLHGIRSGLAEGLPDCAGVSAAADLPIFCTDYWSPAEAAAPLFGDRLGARRLLGLHDGPIAPTATGKGVNVVVVDQGVDKALVERLGGRFGGGWEYLHDPETAATIVPGETKGGHGAMMVRNILDTAPEVTIFDCPMLPTRIVSIRRFLSHADAAYVRMLADIRHLREHDARWRGPWVFVNAWAIYDRASEHPLGDYTDNPHHRFNRLIAQAVAAECDVVFCAGNCGQFCPASRCGAGDRGPGHSIYGANSHPDVLTVGAVRVDGLWLGYSSQGPGQPRLAPEKPDLCAPSQFAEAHDAGTSNTGSSAASALAAGVVAAMRTRWDARTLPPDRLKRILIASARKMEGSAWNGRLGRGILNAGGAFREAARQMSGSS